MGPASVQVTRMAVVSVADARPMMMVPGDVKGEQGRAMLVPNDVPECGARPGLRLARRDARDACLSPSIR